VCHYCGCRQLPLIIDLIAEHDSATALGVRALEAMDRDDLEAADDLLAQLAHELRAHWQGEEDGLFHAMRSSAEYAEYIDVLVREHRALEALLAATDLTSPSDREAVRAAISELAEHIKKEEDGLFPASLTALSGDAWDQAIAAWQVAHPGSTLQTQGS